MTDSPSVPLRSVAVVRTGDKGDLVNVAVVPFDTDDYEALLEQVTEDRVSEAFAHLSPTSVIRYRADGFSALNFVVTGVLDGGVSRSRSLDGHGKSLSSLVARLQVVLGPCRQSHPVPPAQAEEELS